MLFAKRLSQSRCPVDIAVIRSWHIDLEATKTTGAASRLDRLLRGVRPSRSSPTLIRLPITNRLMGVLYLAISVI